VANDAQPFGKLHLYWDTLHFLRITSSAQLSAACPFGNPIVVMDSNMAWRISSRETPSAKAFRTAECIAPSEPEPAAIPILISRRERASNGPAR